MRLTARQINAIKTYFAEIFGDGEVYLFGSRVDDSRKGGDIDLYIRTKMTSNLARKKLDFLVKLKNAIGDQKIDVVIDRRQNRTIDRIAIGQGIRL